MEGEELKLDILGTEKITCSWLLDLTAFSLISGNTISYNSNKELVGFSVVLASVL